MNFKFRGCDYCKYKGYNLKHQRNVCRWHRYKNSGKGYDHDNWCNFKCKYPKWKLVNKTDIDRLIDDLKFQKIKYIPSSIDAF